jgi:hypothetical protein
MIMKKFLIGLMIVVVVAVAAYFGYKHFHHNPPAKAVSTTQTTTKAKSTATPMPSYYVGDTQKEGSLAIKLDSTSGGTSMAELPANTRVFSVNITVTNNDPITYVSPDAFVNESSVYTQVGSDTSTGQYIKAYTTPCFGGGDATVPANQSLSGCVQFIVPTNASVDTYLYNNLKWYL